MCKRNKKQTMRAIVQTFWIFDVRTPYHLKIIRQHNKPNNNNNNNNMCVLYKWAPVQRSIYCTRSFFVLHSICTRIKIFVFRQIESFAFMAAAQHGSREFNADEYIQRIIKLYTISTFARVYLPNSCNFQGKLILKMKENAKQSPT